MLRRSILLCIALLPACGSAAPRPSTPTPLLGKPMRDFKRRTVSGDEVDTRGARGRVIVVEFFAKYCKPCERKLPEAAALARALPDVLFIGISEDERASDASELARRHGVGFPVVHDSQNVLAGRFRISEMPATFVVDGSGIVRWLGGAEHSAEDLENAIVTARSR